MSSVGIYKAKERQGNNFECLFFRIRMFFEIRMFKSEVRMFLRCDDEREKIVITNLVDTVLLVSHVFNQELF